MKNDFKFIISGGGTGGHIFPAIAIANELKDRFPNSKILFVGALGRMEMEKVPEAGFEIIGLDIQGIQRRITWKNILVPFKLVKSLLKAGDIIKKFQPDIAIGVGGYASGPMLFAAARKGVPTLIQEQNSYAGITNKILAKKAKKICVAYEGMEKYFPANKIVLTGNPVRKDILSMEGKRAEAAKYFGLDPSVKTALVIGGSLGARSISDGILFKIDRLIEKDFQIVWQTGKSTYEKVNRVVKRVVTKRIKVEKFISRMDLAYALSDVIVSRAGAGTISELALVNKPVILVPSPNVAEDHQTKNANYLVDKGAAILLKDADSLKELDDLLMDLMEDTVKQEALIKNISKLGIANSAQKIVDEIEKIIIK